MLQNVAWVITLGTPLEYPKWQINRFGGVTPTNGWNINGMCFFVCSSAQLGVKPLDRFWRVMSQNACFWKYCIPLGVRTTIPQFQGVKIPKNRQKLARIGIFHQNSKFLQWQYLQNSKSNQVEIWGSTGDHEVLIQKYKIRSQGSVAWVTWPAFKFWDSLIFLERHKIQTSNFACCLIVIDTKKIKKWVKRRRGLGHVTYFWKFGTP